MIDYTLKTHYRVIKNLISMVAQIIIQCPQKEHTLCYHTNRVSHCSVVRPGSCTLQKGLYTTSKLTESGSKIDIYIYIYIFFFFSFQKDYEDLMVVEIEFHSML